MPVVAQVSDLHLSPRVPERQAQAELVIAGINAAKPDLTVITGDLTDDGWDRPDDLVWAKQWMDDRLDHEWFAVPGNHDVGNFAGAEEGAITDKRNQAWVKAFEDRHIDVFNHQVGDWELLGLNSMTIGSGLYAEIRQWERFVSTQQKGKHAAHYLAVFLHAPLFINTSLRDESSEASYWLGPMHALRPEIGLGRSTLIRDLIGPRLRLIASGHVHQTKLDTVDGTRIVWAPPASGTWVHAPGLPNPPAPEKTGFVLHHLGDDGSVRSEVVECAPMLKTVFFDPTTSE